MVLRAETLERRLAEALASSMAQQHQAVVGREAGWIVGEFESRDRPRIQADASQQILTDQSAVVAGAGADQEDPRSSGQPRDDRPRKRVSQ